jgi:hypothetical protein
MAQSNFTEAGKKAKSNAHGHKRSRTRVCGLAGENIEQENSQMGRVTDNREGEAAG